MELKQINDPADLMSQLNGLGNHFIYRGQSNATWALSPSLERLFGPTQDRARAKKFEDHYIRIFQSKFHLYDTENQQPSTKLAWLAMMQHYGVPTRLLDFSESDYVALYFALEGFTPRQQDDLALFAVDYSAFNKVSLSELEKLGISISTSLNDFESQKDGIFERHLDGANYPLVWMTEPQQLNKRLDRQKGSFVFSTDTTATLEEVLMSPIYRGCRVIKFIINKALHTNIFALLRKMNLDRRVLYGDLHGLGRAIQMEMIAYSQKGG